MEKLVCYNTLLWMIKSYVKNCKYQILSSQTYSTWRTSWYCRSYMKVCFMLAFSVDTAIFQSGFSALHVNLYS
jgi:hypothetical protein